MTYYFIINLLSLDLRIVYIYLGVICNCNIIYTYITYCNIILFVYKVQCIKKKRSYIYHLLLILIFTDIPHVDTCFHYEIQARIVISIKVKIICYKIIYNDLSNY